MELLDWRSRNQRKGHLLTWWERKFKNQQLENEAAELNRAKGLREGAPSFMTSCIIRILQRNRTNIIYRGNLF